MKRLAEIDALRGIAVLCMVVFHFLIDGFFLGLWNFSFDEGFWLVFLRFGQFLFLGLVGASVFLSSRGFVAQLQRGLWILACGFLVTLGTWLVFPMEYVRFGVLHLIGVSVPLVVLFKGREGWGLWLAVALVGLDQFLPQRLAVWGIPFGMPPVGFSSVDYFPLIPWFAVPLVGLFVGSRLYAKREATRLLSLVRVPGLTWLGRHSLAVYLLHQPVLYFSLWVFSHWVLL